MFENIRILLAFYGMFGAVRTINYDNKFPSKSYTYTMPRNDILPLKRKLSQFVNCTDIKATDSFAFSVTVSRPDDTCRPHNLLQKSSVIEFVERFISPASNNNKTFTEEQEKLRKEKEIRDRSNYLATLIVVAIVLVLLTIIIGIGIAEYIKTLRQSGTYRVDP